MLNAAHNGGANAGGRRREIGRGEMRRHHYVRKFGDAVNLGQAMRCRDINAVWSDLSSNSPEESTSSETVTRCSHICGMYVHTACHQSTALR